MLEQVLELNSPFFHLGLALIAYLDTVIGIGFFVPGELAFIAAGAFLSLSGDWTGVMLVLVFAWLGDLTSYYLGRRFGLKAGRRFLKPVKRRRSFRKAQQRLQRHGALFVILSRLMGPVAWITPFLAGGLRMPSGLFKGASAIGVLLGGGQFILLGALGPLLFAQLDVWFDFIVTHWVAILVSLSSLATGVGVWLLVKRHAFKRAFVSLLAVVALFSSINLAYFFVPGAKAVPMDRPAISVESFCALRDSKLLISAGSTALHLPQPINVALLSDRSPEDMMAQLGWVQNKTYSRDDIDLFSFIQLLMAGTPPVSDFRFQNASARSAFQLPGTLSERVHIRWWEAGKIGDKTLYLGAISRDEELAIKYYGAIPSILHDIDPKVDIVRDDLAKQIEAHNSLSVVGLSPLQVPMLEGETSDFETDGGILIVRDIDDPISAEQHDCLKL